VNRGRGTWRFLGLVTMLVGWTQPAWSQIVLAPPSLPDGILNQTYSAGISATGPGSGPITLSEVGAMPPGINFANSGNNGGFFSGTPTATGTYNFYITAAQVGVPSTTQAYSLRISGVLAVTTTGLPDGMMGISYSQQVQATGGVLPYSWVLGTYVPPGSHPVPESTLAMRGVRRVRPAASFTGILPPGLQLSSSGVISGTPTQTGTYTFDVTLTDSSSSNQQGTGATFTININPPNPVAITTPSGLPNGAVGVKYSTPLRAQGGQVPYTWALTSGTLAPGLQLGTDGSLTGTPTQAGNYSFTVTVTDGLNQTSSVTFTLIVVSGFAITTPSLPGGTVGVAYSQQINVTPTTGPYTFSVTSSSGPPGGLTLGASSSNPATTLNGTPTTSGTFTFTIQAGDSAGHTASQSYTLVIAPAPITIAPGKLPDGTVGTPYSQQLTATGGAGGYVFTIGSGAPPGIAVSSSGLLSGTPTAAAAFSFGVTVTDSKQETVTQTYQLTINNPPVSRPTITGVGTTAPPAQQPTISVTLQQPYPTDLSGTLVLTFAPAQGSVDDPSVQFSTGGRSVTFTVPAGQTSAVFPSATVTMGTGTIAGTITLTLHFTAEGKDVTPNPPPMQTIVIGPQAPVITKVTMTNTSGGIEVDVTGFSNTREMVSATFTFQAASGTTLAGGTQTISVGSIFSTWFNDPASSPFGSQFTFAQTFNISGSTSGIANVSVTLTNAQGTSAAVSGQ